MTVDENQMYTLLKTVYDQPPFEVVTDYLMEVPCTNRDESLDYIYRLYRYGEWLYVTDIFPRMFEDDNRCFKRFTSREGYSVDMRKLSVKCLRIFVKEFISSDILNVMVVSGSYADGEKESGESRKLRLYRYFFTPLLEELNLRLIDLSERNAFFLASKQSPLTDDEIINCYANFKVAQGGSNNVQ